MNTPEIAIADPHITSQRLQMVIPYILENNLSPVRNPRQLALALGMQHNNFSRTLAGEFCFKTVQLHAAAELLDLSLDGLFGFSDRVFRSKALSHVLYSNLES